MAIEYNVLALRGADIKDIEYVERFDLDPRIANTPEINYVMLDLIYQDNLKNGSTKERATKLRDSARKDIEKLLAMKGLL